MSKEIKQELESEIMRGIAGKKLGREAIAGAIKEACKIILDKYGLEVFDFPIPRFGLKFVPNGFEEVFIYPNSGEESKWGTIGACKL